jgi:hypothetical protein
VAPGLRKDFIVSRAQAHGKIKELSYR